MTACVTCGQEMGFSDRMNAKSYGGKCIACTSKGRDFEKALSEGNTAEQIVARAEQKKQQDAEIQAIILTTETAPDLKIAKRIEIVTAEVAYGMNIFKDLFAGVRDIVGGRSEAVQSTMREARRAALYELKREAYEVGANAVVGVDLDYVELTAGGTMVMLVASGTAVVIEA